MKSMDNAALGIVTAWHYDFNHQSAKNKQFVKAYLDSTAPAPSPTSWRWAAMTACT